MMENIEKSLQEVLGKQNVLKNEQMSKHTSIRIGRDSRIFFENKFNRCFKKSARNS